MHTSDKCICKFEANSLMTKIDNLKYRVNKKVVKTTNHQ